MTQVLTCFFFGFEEVVWNSDRPFHDTSIDMFSNTSFDKLFRNTIIDMIYSCYIRNALCRPTVSVNQCDFVSETNYSRPLEGDMQGDIQEIHITQNSTGVVHQNLMMMMILYACEIRIASMNRNYIPNRTSLIRILCNRGTSRKLPLQRPISD